MTYEELLKLTEAGVEIWKPIKGYEGYFEISNLGRVKSIERYVTCKDHPHHVKEKIKNIHFNRNNYPCVTLCKEGTSRDKLLHRLLMEAFVPNPENKPEIDHINTDVTDYSFSNLRWVTHKENQNNSITMEHFSIDANSTIQKQRRLNTRKTNGGITAPITVYQYTKEGEFVASYNSTFEAQRATGIHCTGIRRALDNCSQAAGGFMWFTSIQNNIKYQRNLPKNVKPILQFNTNFEKLHEWPSLTEASKVLQLDINMITKSIKNHQPYKGYIFEYKEGVNS